MKSHAKINTPYYKVKKKTEYLQTFFSVFLSFILGDMKGALQSVFLEELDTFLALNFFAEVCCTGFVDFGNLELEFVNCKHISFTDVTLGMKLATLVRFGICKRRIRSQCK